MLDEVLPQGSCGRSRVALVAWPRAEQPSAGGAVRSFWPSFHASLRQHLLADRQVGRSGERHRCDWQTRAVWNRSRSSIATSLGTINPDSPVRLPRTASATRAAVAAKACGDLGLQSGAPLDNVHAPNLDDVCPCVTRETAFWSPADPVGHGTAQIWSLTKEFFGACCACRRDSLPSRRPGQRGRRPGSAPGRQPRPIGETHIRHLVEVSDRSA